MVLASASAGRAALLRAAGLTFTIRPATLDEHAARDAAAARGVADADMPLLLAEQKADEVAAVCHGAMVIGADQTLICNGARLDKPVDLPMARDHLRRLSGRTHVLITAVVCRCGADPPWRHMATARLTMRPLGDDWIDAYLAAAGPDVLGSVGAYRIEELGQHCFAAMKGEYSAIIGLPMLALLGFLRDRGVLIR